MVRAEPASAPTASGTTAQVATSTADEAKRLNLQAFGALQRNRFAEALVPAKAAADLCDRYVTLSPQMCGAILTNLGEALRGLGKNKEAIEVLRHALELRSSKLPANDEEIADSCSNLAAAVTDDGSFAEATLLLMQAVRIDKQNKNLLATLRHASNLGTVQYDENDYDAAMDTLRTALDSAPKRPELAQLRASLLNNVGTVLGAKHDYLGALSQLNAALDLHRRAPIIDERALADTLFNHAAMSRHAGHYADTVRDAREIPTLVPPDSSLIGSTSDELIDALCALGKDAEADAQLEALDAHYRDPASHDDPGFFGYLEVKAKVRWAEGNLDEAVAMYEMDATARARSTAATIALGPERSKLAYLEILRGLVDEISTLDLKMSGGARATRLALEATLRFKSRALDAVADAREALRASNDSSSATLLGQTLFVDSMIANNARIQGVIGDGPLDRKLGSLLTEEREKLEELRVTVETSAALRNLRQEGKKPEVTVADVQAALSSEATLIELAIYSPIDPRRPATPAGPPRYVAYVLKSQGEPRSVDLGRVDAIDELVQQARQQLTTRVRHPDAGKRLYEKVMAPLAPLLGTGSQLFVAPDGGLNLLPFAALVDREGRFLVQTRQITYLTSGRELMRFQRETAPRSPPVLFGAPDYDASPNGQVMPALQKVADDSRGTTGSFRARKSQTELKVPCLGALQGAEKETALVSEILSLPTNAVHEGADASEANFEQVRGPSILHVTSHGFFLDGSEHACGTRSVGVKMKPVTESLRKEPLSPIETLLRSGIALAGANRPSISMKTYDGVVTALELEDVDLSGTELVTLSACATGLGRPSAGEGVYGLRRALSIAGAQTQLLTLWNISDSGTVDLMRSYYEALVHGAGRSEALRVAQVEMVNRGLAPYYWAPFIVSGDPSPLHLAPPASP